MSALPSGRAPESTSGLVLDFFRAVLAYGLGRLVGAARLALILAPFVLVGRQVDRVSGTEGVWAVVGTFVGVVAWFWLGLTAPPAPGRRAGVRALLARLAGFDLRPPRPR